MILGFRPGYYLRDYISKETLEHLKINFADKISSTSSSEDLKQKAEKYFWDKEKEDSEKMQTKKRTLSIAPLLSIRFNYKISDSITLNTNHTFSFGSVANAEHNAGSFTMFYYAGICMDF